MDLMQNTTHNSVNALNKAHIKSRRRQSPLKEYIKVLLAALRVLSRYAILREGYNSALAVDQHRNVGRALVARCVVRVILRDETIDINV
jgi:hypothetical protein